MKLDLDYNNQLGDGKLGFSASPEDYISGRVAPGIYEITIEGSVSNSVEKTTTFRINLLDPCNRPEGIQIVGVWPSEVKYTITDEPKMIDTPEFRITPDYCEMEIECVIDDITGDSLIIDTDPGSNPPSLKIDSFNSLEGLGES